MPPKKSKDSNAKHESKQEQMELEAAPEEIEDQETEDGDPKEEKKDDTDAPRGHKRKQSSTESNEPNKATKTSPTRDDSKSASATQVLKFLVSEQAIEISRPDDESKDLEKRGKATVTYSSSLRSPFEELLCAVILSRPISHMLGLRTIRMILNPPYEFSSPEAIQKAGSEKVREAIWEAHTQHKDKTAAEIDLIAIAVSENDWNASLEGLRKETGNVVDEEREVLQKSIKGLGKTGLDIFYRRIQWLWKESYPFIDVRTKGSVGKLGLPEDPEEMAKFIDEKWGDFKVDIEGEDEEERKRKALVLVLERAVGVDLEKKSELVLEKAAQF